MKHTENWQQKVYKPSEFPQDKQVEWNELRKKIIIRDKYVCQACQVRKRKSELTVHHIVPRDCQGSDHPDNLITLCSPCHDYVEAKGFREINLIKGCTKRSFEMQLDSIENSQGKHQKIDNETKSQDYQSDKSRIVTFCPNCRRQFARLRNNLGTKFRSFKCKCGMRANYSREIENFIWVEPRNYRSTPTNQDDKSKEKKDKPSKTNQQVDPKKEQILKPPIDENQKEMQFHVIEQSPLIVKNSNLIRCPKCKTLHKSKRDFGFQLYSITCKCGSSAKFNGREWEWIILSSSNAIKKFVPIETRKWDYLIIISLAEIAGFTFAEEPPRNFQEPYIGLTKDGMAQIELKGSPLKVDCVTLKAKIVEDTSLTVSNLSSAFFVMVAVFDKSSFTLAMKWINKNIRSVVINKSTFRKSFNDVTFSMWCNPIKEGYVGLAKVSFELSKQSNLL